MVPIVARSADIPQSETRAVVAQRDNLALLDFRARQRIRCEQTQIDSHLESLRLDDLRQLRELRWLPKPEYSLDRSIPESMENAPNRYPRALPTLNHSVR